MLQVLRRKSMSTCMSIFQHLDKQVCRNFKQISQLNARFSNSAQKLEFRERIFSGIQPTGSLHLGNYFGAVRRWVELQNEGRDVIYSVVDLHSITMPQEPSTLRRNILEMVASLLACGLDPDKCIIFLQSQVPYHTQLSWVLGCFMSLARLDNLPSFKEKAAMVKETPLGLFVYPVLQSADILLYKATLVPVGEDQEQHLQVTRHLVRLFNRKYGNIFPSPKSLTGELHSSRLRSLRKPDKKMSKSESDPRGRIQLIDTPDEIREKFKKAVTDCTSAVTFDPVERPGVSNLLTIHSLFSGLTTNEICEQMKGKETAEYKTVVAECVIEKLSPTRKKIVEYLHEPGYLEQVLTTGAEKASIIARQTWLEVTECLGLKY